MLYFIKSKNGVALITVLAILLIVSVLAITLSTNSIIDLKITENIKSSTKNFFLSDEANQMEIASIPFIGVSNIVKKNQVLRNVNKQTPFLYHSKINYLYFRKSLIPGSSLNFWNSYYYKTETTVGSQTTITCEYQLGPNI